MKEQNFKNHPRYVPLYHYVLTVIVLTVLVLSVINIVSGITLPSVIFLLVAVAFVIIFIIVRTFPLTVQDRAIRAEENLRHYVLTGKLLNARLTIQQIIALRFAADDEFVALAERAAKENLSNKSIKQAIKSWRPDYHRA